jgi:hypothetical protein
VPLACKPKHATMVHQGRARWCHQYLLPAGAQAMDVYGTCWWSGLCSSQMLAGMKATSQHVPILISYVRIGKQLQNSRWSGVSINSRLVSLAAQGCAACSRSGAQRHTYQAGTDRLHCIGRPGTGGSGPRCFVLHMHAACRTWVHAC